MMDRFNGLDVPESLADALDAQTLAFLVYDMQAGILSQIPDGDRVMSNVQRLLAVTRKRRVRTVFTRHYFMPTQLAGVFQLRQAKIWQGKAHAAETRPLIPHGSAGFSSPVASSRDRTSRSSTRSPCRRSKAPPWTSCCVTAACAPSSSLVSLLR